MNKIWGLLLCTFFIAPALAQNKFIASVKSTTGESLAGATVAFKELKIGASANTNGLIYIGDIPNGTHAATFSFIGFKPKTLNLSFPLQQDTLNVALAADDDELDEIIVSSTRARGSITDVPTRMEVLTTEELGEKSVMKPGDIRMVLNETTGITTQQTSATSGNTSIRIQGLDGRYTQILKDGFPLYAGFSGGLSLLQTPPLDLKQVEIIKGSASTLYGGGAIAGLVNLISKTPSDKRELSFQVNGTSAGGLDLNSFYAEKYGKAGITVFAAHNRSKAYDPSDVGFSAIPEVQRFTFNPKLFIDISDKSALSFGLNSGYERRIGGDMHYIRGENDPAHPFFEKNLSKRLSSQLAFDHQLNPQTNLSFKNSLNYFNRDLSVPSSSFSGEQFSSFSEFTLDYTKDKSEWIFGANFWSDSFREKDVTNVIPRDYDQEIFGLFAQNTYQLSEKTAIETGLRGDYVNHYGLVLLPRVSALFKLSSKVSSRIGGGFGYQTPNIFTDEAEQLHFEKVLPINTTQTKLEKSVGGNIDFNYRTTLFTDQVGVSLNQLFFYTYLNKPLQLKLNNNNYSFTNANGHIDTKGIETNAKFSYKDFALFLGYTFTDTKEHENNTLTWFRLTPKHRINSVLVYEVEDQWKIGLEAYYYSEQKLSDGAIGKSYWLTGFLIEKMWDKFSLYANFENYLDTRQTRFDSIYTGSVANPVFRDIYAPLDGFVFNGGIKITL